MHKMGYGCTRIYEQKSMNNFACVLIWNLGCYIISEQIIMHNRYSNNNTGNGFSYDINVIIFGVIFWRLSLKRNLQDCFVNIIGPRDDRKFHVIIQNNIKYKTIV